MPGKVGHPSPYDAKMHPKLAFWLAQAGLTMDQMAAELGVHIDTVYEWQKKHKKFSDAIKSGKETPDDEVEASLLRKAKGFTYTEDGKERTAHPDTVACIFWLKNRRPDKWRDRREHDVTGTIRGPLLVMMGDDDDAG